jgi:hypothetical protein
MMREILMPIIKSLGASLGSMLFISLLLPLFTRNRQVSEETIRLVNIICEKVVMALQQSQGELPGTEKRRLALEMVAEILRHFRIKVPQSVIDIGIEAAVLLIKNLGRKAV